jgi:hypothetical protein
MSDENVNAGTGEQLTVEQAYAMLDFYEDMLEKQGYTPVPYPDVDALVGGTVYRGAKFDCMNHAYWMCEQTRMLIRQGRWSKAQRWVGMIQGLVFMGGLCSISQLKTHNRVGPRVRHESSAPTPNSSGFRPSRTSSRGYDDAPQAHI